MAHKTKLLSRNHQTIYKYEQDPPEIVSRYLAAKLSSFENSRQTHVTTKIKQTGNIKKRVITYPVLFDPVFQVAKKTPYTNRNSNEAIKKYI
jgi:hypothetical protein